MKDVEYQTDLGAENNQTVDWLLKVMQELFRQGQRPSELLLCC